MPTASTSRADPDHACILYAQMKELADWMLEGRYRDFFCTLFNQRTGQPMAPEDDENWCGRHRQHAVLYHRGQHHALPKVYLVQLKR